MHINTSFLRKKIPTIEQRHKESNLVIPNHANRFQICNFYSRKGFMLPMIPLTIHTSSIDLNYCSSVRLSEDKELMWRGFAPRRSVQSGHLCCRFQPILYDNSVYLFRHTSTPKAYLGFSLGQERRYKDSNLDNDFTRWRDQRSPVIPLHHICIAEQFPFFTCSTLPQVQVSFSQRLAPSFEWQPLNPVPCAKFNRYIDQHLYFCNKHTRGVLATSPVGIARIELATTRI